MLSLSHGKEMLKNKESVEDYGKNWYNLIKFN